MAKQKGDFYGRGLALQYKPLQDTARGETLQATDVPATSKPAEVCKRGKCATLNKCQCGLLDHLQLSYNKCELNAKNIALWAKAEEEKETARKAMEENMMVDANGVVEA